MQRPRREEFILEVRRSARRMQEPTSQAESDTGDIDAIAKILRGAARWLTPEVVDYYDPGDFAASQPEQRVRLGLAVDGFRKIAERVFADNAPTIDQFTEGASALRDLINVLGQIVRDEWMQAIGTIEKQAEEWCAEVQWRTRRVNKKFRESLIGNYEAPQLLIFAEPNLYVLDPVARFIPGGQGSFDLSIQPSYHTTSLYRDESGTWFVHLDVRNGVSNGKRVEWNKDAFHQCIEQLRVLV